MDEFLSTSLCWPMVISLFGYLFGQWLRQKTRIGLCNPLLIASVAVILFLLIFQRDGEAYAAGTSVLSYLLTPATVCLAVPLYEQIGVFRRNWRALTAGILAGVVASIGSVSTVALLFHLTHSQYITLLPKSVTTAIGIVLAEELGGYPSITAAIIIITGLWGGLTASLVCRLSGITHPVAVGVAIGSSSHVIGTTKALELDEIQGAMSSLSIVLSGLLTCGAAAVVSRLC